MFGLMLAETLQRSFYITYLGNYYASYIYFFSVPLKCGQKWTDRSLTLDNSARPAFFKCKKNQKLCLWL